MGRLINLMTGVTVLTVLASGCGSTSNDDQLVMQFLQFDNTGLTQADSVGESSADIDVFQGICPGGTGGVPTSEPYTQTVINAIFQNNEGSDIQLQGYMTQIADQRLSQSNIVNGALGTTLPGGRCLGTSQPCVTASDCALAGVSGGTCSHSQTTVSGIVLYDFVGKAVVATVSQVHPDVLGQAIPLKVTFFGSDPNRSFQTAANYLVTFGDYDNCMTSSGGGAGAS